MKLAAIPVVAAGLIAIPASASFMPVDHSNTPVFTNGNGVTISAQRIGDYDPGRAAVESKFQQMGPGAGYLGFVGSTLGGAIGNDDYDSTGTADYELYKFKFVGGYAAGAGIIYFDFFNAAGTQYVDGFGLDLSAQGTGGYIWTITINNPFLINNDGLVQMSGGTDVNATQALWYATNAQPTIGTAVPGNAGTYDYGLGEVDIDWRFEMITPAPGALALLGLAGLAGTRRRR